MHDHDSILVSVPEFADKTSLSVRHVWRLISEGRIPSIRVGRRRVIPIDPALEALRANDTSAAALSSGGMQMGSIPVITNEDWPSIHGTHKVSGGALKGETDDGGHLHFTCPSCGEDLTAHLAGVTCDFVEWNHNPSEKNNYPTPTSVFEVHCWWCGLNDHFKIPCDQHGKYWPGKPLPQSQSRRARRSDEPHTASIPIVSDEKNSRVCRTNRPTLRTETDSDYLIFYCPSCDSILRGGGTRLVSAVTNSKHIQRDRVIQIAEFQFEISCGAECGFVGDFTIQVSGQTLRLLEC